MYKWEDESWSEVTLQAGYTRNDRRCMETYMVVPATKGDFHVYIEADGEFVVKHIGGNLDGSWLGNIAYDVSQRGWTVGDYKGCSIKNFQSNTTFVPGHPDASMNGKQFDPARAVEVDWYASFELHCEDDDGSWRIYPPAIQKDYSYNYTVSYGEYTDKYCEWGAVSISIDENNNSTGAMPNKIKLRRGLLTQSDLEGKLDTIQPRERQPDHETLPFGMSDSGPTIEGKGKKKLNEEEEIPSSPPSLEEIPLVDDIDPWSNIDYRSSHYPKIRDDPDEVKTTGSKLRGNLKPPGLPLGRTSKPFEVKPKLLETWDPEHFDPGYTNEHVAAATILAGGNVHDGRDMIEERENKILNKRKSWLPSLGGSTTSTLQGGALSKFKEREREQMSKLTTAQRAIYESIKNSQGRVAAGNYLKDLEERGRISPL